MYLDTFTRYFPQNVSRYKILDTLFISSIFRYRYKILLKIHFFKMKDLWHFHNQIAVYIIDQNIDNWAFKLKECPISYKVRKFLNSSKWKWAKFYFTNCEIVSCIFLSGFNFFEIQIQDTFTKMYLDTRYRYFPQNVSRYRYKYLLFSQKMYLRYKVSKIIPSLVFSLWLSSNFSLVLY